MNDGVRVQWQKVLAVTLGLCVTVSFFRFIPHTYRHFHANILPSEQAKSIRKFLAEVIPPDASVSAPSQLVPHLAHRQFVYLFPNPFQRAGYGPSVATLKQLDGRLWVRPVKTTTLHKRMREKPVDYIVLKAGRHNTWPLKPEYYEGTAIGVLTCRDYGVVAVKGDIVVSKRGANFELGLTKLRVSIARLVSEREVSQGSDSEVRKFKFLEREVRRAWERLREGEGWQADGHFGGLP